MTQRLNFAFELKALSAREIEGHGSIFGNVDLGDDIVMRGAFKRTLAAHKKAGTLPLMFWMHDPSQVPGVWTDMAEDDEGLFVKGELVDTQLGNEVRTLLQKKAVRGLSIGYQTVDQDFRDDGTRLIKEVNLWEVSVVSLAMNPLAQVEAAKARLSAKGEWVPTSKEFERLLRDAGCSRTVAATLVAMVKNSDPDLACAMLRDDHLRDAGEIDESKAALDALAKNIDSMFAAAIAR